MLADSQLMSGNLIKRGCQPREKQARTQIKAVREGALYGSPESKFILRADTRSTTVNVRGRNFNLLSSFSPFWAK